ncbi:MAG: hypothetical protein J5501_09145 [Ruminococcus sp.]|nr:hypothetical protein [Ruminococcus sp.]
MKKLYIVLIKAHTGLGAVARRITHYPYTHIAVSTDRSMTDFISFSRRYHYFPFESGITHEYRHYYAFGRHRDFRAKVFELTVDDEHYRAVMDYISECESDRKMMFNIFSMATMPVIGGFRIPHSENCMSFTARCIELSGCVNMERPFWRYSIKDMDELLSEHLYFEGRIVRGSVPDDGYMTPFRLLRFLSGMLRVFSVLTYRLLSGRE